MKLILTALFMVASAQADRINIGSYPSSTLERLKKLYPDQSEAFIQKRLDNAKTPFEKWRSFPPYYFELLTRLNHSQVKKINNRRGLCAGDPHLENFGFIYAPKPYFTLNDLDDVSECSLDADILRLLVGYRLLGASSVTSFILSYLEGLKGSNTPYPQLLVDLEQDSLIKRTQLPKKYKKLAEASGCDGEFLPVTDEEEKALQDFATTENKIYTKACAHLKDSGGSAGNKRFVVFHKAGAFELKPLAQPAPLYQEVTPILVRQEIFTNAVGTFFSESLKTEYYPVTFKNLSYQRRPIWAGNRGINQDELTPKDLNEIMLYEAQTLGKMHRITNPSPVLMDLKEFERTIETIERKWRSEFAEQ